MLSTDACGVRITRLSDHPGQGAFQPPSPGVTYGGAATGTRNDALFWTISTEAAECAGIRDGSQIGLRPQLGGGCLSLVLVKETHTDPHVNLSQIEPAFSNKNGIFSFSLAALPAVLQLLSAEFWRNAI